MSQELSFNERSQLIESDSNAIVSTGHNAFKVLPVLIWENSCGQKWLIEVDRKFMEAAAVKGFLRFEKTPQARSVQV
jgi:hypothetical protein